MRIFLMFTFAFFMQSAVYAADPGAPNALAKWSFGDLSQYDVVRGAVATSGNIPSDYQVCQTDGEQSVQYFEKLPNNWPDAKPEVVSSFFASDNKADDRCMCLMSWQYVGMKEPRTLNILHSGTYKAFPAGRNCTGDPIAVTQLDIANIACKPVKAGEQSPSDNNGKMLTTRCDIPLNQPIGNYRVCLEDWAIHLENGTTKEIGSATLVADETFYAHEQSNSDGNAYLAGYTKLAPSCFDIWNRTDKTSFLSIGVRNLGDNGAYAPIKSIDIKLYKIGE